MTHESGRIAVLDSLLLAIGENFYDPSVGFQANAHHGFGSQIGQPMT
jgi:hypothetical protein